MAIPVTIVGNLVRDPEIKITQGGTAVVNTTVAVNERTQKNGEWVDGEPTYWRVSMFNKMGEAFADTARKGDLVVVTGTLKVGSYEKDGVKHTTTDITAKHIGIVPKPNKNSERAESW